MNRLVLQISQAIYQLHLQLREAAQSERGDLSTYLAQGVLALAAVSMTGVILLAFTDVGNKLQAIVNAWTNLPISV